MLSALIRTSGFGHEEFFKSSNRPNQCYRLSFHKISNSESNSLFSNDNFFRGSVYAA